MRTIKNRLRRFIEKEGFEVVSSSIDGQGLMGIKFRKKPSQKTGQDSRRKKK